jgi:hypothetical protein
VVVFRGSNKKRREYSDVSARLLSLLDNLRVPYKKGTDEVSKGVVLALHDFGIVIHISKTPREPVINPGGETYLFYCAEFKDKEISKFGEDLMWALIRAGYFAFLREHVPGGERIFRRLLLEHGWGYKIVNRRKEEWESLPSKRFLLRRLKKLTDEMAITEIIARWQGFFDFEV